MTVDPGTRLRHYDIVSLIGEGAMGLVYRATDTRLNRQVALKILPDAFASDPDRLARFRREAQVLASLNHPGIAAIYGVEEDDAEDIRALVLELVEGPSLADRIAQAPIPLREALSIAGQIAAALAAAHQAGVIHRDLKPDNIKVRPDGTVKVLDFGLAKALDPGQESDANESPTRAVAATEAGMVLGTAAYMAPEQARGKSVDKRADIWAFGVVVFEMLTGRRPFEGDDDAVTLANVLQTEPAWDRLPRQVPPVCARYLRGCLRKDPDQRVRDIGDVCLAGAFEAPVTFSAAVGGAAQRHRWPRALPALVGALLVALVSGLAAWGTRRPDPPGVVRFTMAHAVTPPLHVAAVSQDVAISPDGRHVAYLTGSVGVGAERLHVHAVDQLAAETLVTEGELNSPFFSPDGATIGFYNRARNITRIQRVSVNGGPTSTISEIPGALRGASWGADDTIVFATQDSTTGLWRVPAGGGDPEPLTTPDIAHGELDHLWPQVLPGGKAVLFTILADPIGESAIAALSLDTGEQTLVLRGGSYSRYSPSGHLLYGVGGNLWAVGFDHRRLETVGDPAPVLEDVLTKEAGTVDYDLSENGSLIYVPDVSAAAAERTMVWVDRQGQEEPLDAPPGPYESPRLSPDGQRVAVDVVKAAMSRVLVYDLVRRTPTRLTLAPGVNRYPLWSPDGQRVLFTSNRDGWNNIYATAADGTGPVERVTTSPSFQVPQSWSADGHSLVIMDTPHSGGVDLKLVSMDAPTRTAALVTTGLVDVYAEVSPDGRWIAYASGGEVWVRPFPEVDGGRWQISRDGGGSPVWGPDGQELFFRHTETGDMMVVTVNTESTFAPGSPALLFPAPYIAGQPLRTRPWDVAADGRFLMVKEGAGEEAEGAPYIVVVQHWAHELTRLAPVE